LQSTQQGEQKNKASQFVGLFAFSSVGQSPRKCGINQRVAGSIQQGEQKNNLLLSRHPATFSFLPAICQQIFLAMRQRAVLDRNYFISINNYRNGFQVLKYQGASSPKFDSE
jgi:hypothetical protein